MAYMKGDKLLIDGKREAIAMNNSVGYNVTVRYYDRVTQEVDIKRVKRLKHGILEPYNVGYKDV